MLLLDAIANQVSNTEAYPDSPKAVFRFSILAGVFGHSCHPLPIKYFEIHHFIDSINLYIIILGSL